ncbi:MAG TPA: M50 family metallopeptidase [Candidatus Obscuribacterales bacterium]
MIKQIASAHAKTVAGDLWHALRHHRTVQIMVVFLILSLICWQMPVISMFLYPFKLFVTTIHEACHALAARLTGGNVGMITISPDESGLTLSMGGFRPLVTMAGYLGTAVFGGLLIWWGRNPKEARFVLQSIGTVILALTIFYGGGGIFSFVAMFLIGLGILYVSRKASEMVCHMFLLILAVQTTLSSVIDIQTLFFASMAGVRHSDAKTMEDMTGIPAIIWSVVWGGVAVVILLFSFWYSYKPDKSSLTAPDSDRDKGNARTAQIGTKEDPALIAADVEQSLEELKIKTASEKAKDDAKQKVNVKQGQAKKK